jgi:hypothetical protein
MHLKEISSGISKPWLHEESPSLIDIVPFICRNIKSGINRRATNVIGKLKNVREKVSKVRLLYAIARPPIVRMCVREKHDPIKKYNTSCVFTP